MPVFRGLDANNQSSEIFNIPCYIKSFSLTNDTGSSSDVTVAITDSDEDPMYYIYSGTIAATDCVLYDVPIKILQGYKIFVNSSGSNINYYFTIE
jgi:hypothetical protein